MPIGVILSIIVFQILVIFVHLAVYATMAAAFHIGGLVFEIIFIILALTFTSASIITHYCKGKIVDWYYTFAAYWFGLVHFLFGGAVIFFIALNIFYHYTIPVSTVWVGVLCFAPFFLLHLYGTWKSGRAEITKETIKLSDGSGFNTEFWKGKKIVFMSDIHLGNVRGKKFLERIVKKIQALDPHAVFIGGDLFDGVKCDEAALIEPLRSLRTPGGTYFITGNHEYYLPNVSEAIDRIRATGTKVLDNEKIDIGGIDIVGVDYMTVHKEGDLKKTLEMIGIDHSKPSILLKHEPNDLEVAEAAGLSLGFFGHTHQGQIFPLSLITKQIYNGFDYGLKAHGTMQVYTSSGVGTWGPPLRLGTKSEIVLVEFV